MKSSNRDESISISIWEDGSMKITDCESECVIAVQLAERERRMIWDFKFRAAEEEDRSWRGN